MTEPTLAEQLEDMRQEMIRGHHSGYADWLKTFIPKIAALEAREGEALARVMAKVEELDNEIRGIRTHKVMSGFRSDYYVPLPQVIGAIQRLKVALAEIAAETKTREKVR